MAPVHCTNVAPVFTLVAPVFTVVAPVHCTNVAPVFTLVAPVLLLWPLLTGDEVDRDTL